MATYSALTGAMTRLVQLMEGYRDGIVRPIGTRHQERFRHIPFEAGSALAPGDVAPYPFEIVDGGEQAAEEPQTLSATRIWAVSQQTIRVAYANNPQDQHARLQTIREDRATLRRTLDHQRSWTGVNGLSLVRWIDGRIVPEQTQGADDSAPEPMLVLEVTLELRYREDHDG